MVSSVSELTGYPESVIDGVLSAMRLYLLDRVADEVIESDYKPETLLFDVYPFGTVKFSRDLMSKNADKDFEFLPDKDFYDDFKRAYFYGKTPLIDIVETNFRETMKEFTQDNLLDLKKVAEDAQ